VCLQIGWDAQQGHFPDRDPKEFLTKASRTETDFAEAQATPSRTETDLAEAQTRSSRTEAQIETTSLNAELFEFRDELVTLRQLMHFRNCSAAPIHHAHPIEDGTPLTPLPFNHQKCTSRGTLLQQSLELSEHHDLFTSLPACKHASMQTMWLGGALQGALQGALHPALGSTPGSTPSCW
jgi:hypothetical protein